MLPPRGAVRGLDQFPVVPARLEQVIRQEAWGGAYSRPRCWSRALQSNNIQPLVQDDPFEVGGGKMREVEWTGQPQGGLVPTRKLTKDVKV